MLDSINQRHQPQCWESTNGTNNQPNMDESPSTNSISSPPDATYGFIGLGNMGFGMAKNVREKIPSSSKLIVCELVTSQRDKFVKEIEGDIEVAETPKQIGEKCVCMSPAVRSTWNVRG